jgi:hypothetical protein
MIGMEKEREEALQWFVDFANMNLETIKPGDKAKLLIESEEFLWPWELKESGFPLPDYMLRRDLSEDTSDEIEGELSGDYPDIYKRFLRDMAWAFEEPPPRESEKNWKRLVAFQDIVKETLQDLTGTHTGPEKITRVPPPGGLRYQGDTIIAMKLDAERFSMTYLPLTKSPGRYIQVKLCRLLDGLPRSTIYKCPGCKKYFFNPTHRKKNFCSPRCMWRVNTQRRRDADREAYRKYQRELMRDRYRENGGQLRLKTKSRKAKKGEREKG